MNTSLPETDPRAASRSIWVFTPSRTDPKDLEEILVQRHELLKDAVERVRESALTDHKHHLLFVGPRGCGKTHLITLIVSRISADAEASEQLRLAWLNEDETCTSPLELLLKIHAALEKRYPADFQAASLSAAYELKPAAALDFIADRLLANLAGRTLVIVTENLDALFDAMGREGQQQLRAFIQEHPQFSIVASAQRLVEDLADRNSPFFGFFQTEHLKPLSVDQATKLLRNIARIQGKVEVTGFLTTSRGRSRVRALHHLSGGNHRIYIVLSQFITRETMDALIGPFLKMVDELTPYYQERMRWLPPLQRKIVEMLCTCDTTVPVKEIARRLFSTPQTISKQLQDLREKGYVESSQRGRESLYEISEPLMRICVEVKENQNTQPLRLLVDFLRVWYDDGELKKRLGLSRPETQSYSYLSTALERNSTEGNLRATLLFRELDGAECLCFSREEVTQATAETQEAILQAAHCWKDNDTAGASQAIAEADSEDLPAIDKYLLYYGSAYMHHLQGDSAAAMADYTRVIDLLGAPPEQVAQALYNRGVTHGQQGDSAAAIADYTRVIDLPGAPPDQVAKALYNRGVTHGQQGGSAAEIADYTRVIDLPGAPPEQVAKALNNRGVTHGQQGDSAAAMADYTRVIDLPGATPEQVAKALYNRGVTHGQQGDSAAAIADYTRVIDLPGAPPDQVAKALFNRGITHGQQGDSVAEIADYTRVIDLPGAPPEQVAQALNNRGITHGQQGDRVAEIADYTRVIDLPGATPEQVVDALYNRGITHGQQGDIAAAIADYTRVIDLPGAAPEQVAEALNNRGVTHGQQGDSVAEIADYTRVVDLPGATPEQVANALNNRGVTHGQQGDSAAEMADYTRVIDLPGATPEQVANALNNRGITHGQQGDSAAEMADYTRVIDLPGAPPEQVAKALNNRGVTHGQQGDSAAAIADYTCVIDLPGAPPEQVAWALNNRGVAHLNNGQKREAESDFETILSLHGAPVTLTIEAHLALGAICLSEGRWSDGFKAIESSLTLGAEQSPNYFDAPVDVIGVLFGAGLTLEGRRKHSTMLYHLYSKHAAIAVLGEALVKHLGVLFAQGQPWPASDNLDQWLTAWEQASADALEFKLPLRLLRSGIDFLKSGGADETTLLDLTAPERSLLRQAFGLETLED